ncbi:MAG TPA: hypothetical protein VFR34_14960 [Paracoccaceae bacterium]|nr:hypothetical protein [Paracoccaceae bacterium]
MLKCSTPGPGGATFALAKAVDKACQVGNPSNKITSSTSLFGLTGWILSQKNEDPSAGTGVIKFSKAPVNNTLFGLWGIADYAGFTNVLIALKAGNGFAAFLLDTNYHYGIWAITKKLSNATIYYQGAPKPIPLPAAGLLMVGGIGALALLAARRRKVA